MNCQLVNSLSGFYEPRIASVPQQPEAFDVQSALTYDLLVGLFALEEGRWKYRALNVT